MKVDIVYQGKGDKQPKEVSFEGTHADVEGFKFIYYQQPVKVIAIRLVTDDMAKGFAWKGK